MTLGFDDADRVRGYLEDVIEELLRIYDRADRTAVAETWVELYRLELTEQWHKSGPEEKRSLAEYLLMTDEEYSDWVRHGR